MLKIKTFNDFILDNTKLDTKDVCEKLVSIDIDVSIVLSKYLCLLYLPNSINNGLIIFVCSLMEYMKYKFRNSLDPSDN